jgi:type IV pilus assembly protein PilF
MNACLRENTGWAVALLVLLASGCASTAERKVEQSNLQRQVDTNTQLGAGYLQQGQFDVAREKIDRALELEPDDPQANSVMALLQWRLQNHEAAERHFRRALASPAGSVNPDVQHNYGAFLCDRGRVEESLPWFERAIANPQYPTPELAYLNAGLCALKKPDRVTAERFFRAALQRNPNLAPALLQMARLSLGMDNAILARGFIERYFRNGPETPESLLLAAKIERVLGNRNAEGSYAMRLKGKYPDAPETQEYLRATGKVKP